jgi:hypothetical protein
MKGIRIEKGSWHYWLATKMGWQQWRDEVIIELNDEGKPNRRYVDVEGDFCSYVRRALLGTLVMILVVLIASGILGVFLWLEFNAWRQNYLCVFHHQCSYTPLASCGNAVQVCIAVLVGVIWGIPALSVYVKRRRHESHMDNWEKQEERRKRRAAKYEAKLLRQLARQNNETFMKLAYRSIKDKVCFKIELSD